MSQDTQNLTNKAVKNMLLCLIAFWVWTQRNLECNYSVWSQKHFYCSFTKTILDLSIYFTVPSKPSGPGWQDCIVTMNTVQGCSVRCSGGSVPFIKSRESFGGQKPYIEHMVGWEDLFFFKYDNNFSWSFQFLLASVSIYH